VSNQQNTACLEWDEKLAALHPNDLILSEKHQLSQHLETCADCRAMYHEYQQHREQISLLSKDDVPVELPQALLQLKASLEPGKKNNAPVPLLVENSRLQEMKEPAMPPKVVPSPRKQPSLAKQSFPHQVGLFYLDHIRSITLVSGVLVVLLAVSFSLNILKFPLPVSSQAGGYPIRLTNQLVIDQSIVYDINGDVYTFNSQNGSPGYASHLKALNLDPFSRSLAIVDGVIYLQTRSTDPAQESPANIKLSAIRESDGQLLWQYSIGRATGETPVVNNGTVYTSGILQDGHAYLFALRANDGALRWRFQERKQDAQFGLSAPTPDVVYVTSDAFKLYALNALNGTLLWEHSWPEGSNSVLSNLAFRQTTLYVSLDTTLYAIAENGKFIWQAPLDGFVASMASDNADVYVDTDNGIVYALNSRNGHRIWQKKVGDQAGSLLAFNNTVYMGAVKPRTDGSVVVDGYLVALHTNDGTLSWQYKVAPQCLPSLAANTDLIYVAPSSEVVVALLATTGQVRWQSTVKR
jgi:outer membrane protein assembly factor BamB